MATTTDFIHPDDLAALRRLEESLWRSETRYDAALVDELLADDFVEFGRSGRIYTRSDMIPDGSAPADIQATLPLPEFRARHLSDDLVQVTYVSEVERGDGFERANRCSLWTRTDRGWRLRFHQGTPRQ